MDLAINLFSLTFIFFVSLAMIFSAEDRKKIIFWLRTVTFSIPIFLVLRQVLILTDYISFFPSYLFVVYFLYRCLGLTLNFYVHHLVGKKINYFSILNVITYLFLIYILCDYVYYILVAGENEVEYILNHFHTPSWFSSTYPLLLLAHVIQVVLLLKNDKNASLLSHLNLQKKVIKNVMFITAVMIVGVQMCHIFQVERRIIEYYIVPIVYMLVYGAIAFFSMMYSNIYRDAKIRTLSKRLRSMLTEREQEILLCLQRGLSDKEIANELNVSPSTVRSYCQRIYPKLGVNNRIEAVIFANSLDSNSSVTF